MENWIPIISLLLNLFLGGGLIVTLVTLKAQKKRATADAELAEANAKEREIENVDRAIAIWREIAEKIGERNSSLIKQNEELVKQHTDLTNKLGKLERQVSRLNTINTKIVKLLDQITPENLEKKVSEIKQQISKNED